MENHTSPVTEQARNKIEEQIKYTGRLRRIEESLNVHSQEFSNVSSTWKLSPEEVGILRDAVRFQAEAINRQIAEQENALDCGSESGNLSVQSEKDILDGCLALLEEAGGMFKDYLEFMGIEPDCPEEEPCFQMYYSHIVKRLLLWRTRHSGGTSTRAKCRQLGVDGSEMFTIFRTEEENE